MFGRAAGRTSLPSQAGIEPRRTRSDRRRSFLAALVLATFTAQLGLAPAALADPASPLTVTKTATPNPVASGAQLTYTIVVQNTGGAKVDNVVLTDQVNGVGVVQTPPALPQLIITSSKGSCTQGGPNGNLVTCNAGSLEGREVWTVTIRGQVTAPNNTTLNNTASVTGTKSAQTFTTTGSASVLVSGGTGGGDLPDLTINKTGPTSVAPLTVYAYTLTINNLGTANTSNVRVVDTLPAGVTFVSTSTTSLFSCQHDGSPTGGTVTCTGGAVNQGQNASIAINVESPGATGQITNTAVVDPDNTIAESNELNNTSSFGTSVGGPPPDELLSILKTDGNPDIDVSWDTGAGPDPVNPGEELVYKIQVKNNASSRADDVRVTDTTQGLEASSLNVSMVLVDGAVGVGGGCQVVAPHAICEIRSLNAGGTLTMTVRGMVIAPAGATIFNTATVHGNIKNTGVTNTATEATTIRPSIDLTITKDDGPDPACARTWPTTNPNQHLASPPDGLAAASGDIPVVGLLAPAVCLGGLTYSFVIGNSGNGDATNVTVRDLLPAGLIFDSYESTAGLVCSVDAGNAVTCTGGAIAAADTETLTFRLVAPPTVGSITNTVVVDPNNAIFEPDETNNTDVETTTISTGVDLVIWKGDDTFDTVDSDPTDEDPPGGAPALTEGFDPIATNGTQTYTIIVDNVGPQDVTGIKVRDVLPAGTKFLSFNATNGFTCTHDGSTFGGNVTCIGGHLLGTAAEFYQKPGTPPPAAPGDDRATIVIKVFATPFVQPIMHNEVRVDPDGEIAEINELNNFAFQNTVVTVGNGTPPDDKGAFNQLTVDKTQTDPSIAAGDPSATVAQNGIVIYELKVSNLGTDPASAIVVKDFLPAGSRFIEAVDTDVGTGQSDAFFCIHDGAAAGGVVTCLSGDLSGSVNTIPDSLGGTVPTFRTIRIKIFAPNTPGTYANIAVVDPDNLIPEGNEFDNDDAAFTTVTIGGNNMFNELNVTKEQTSPTATCGGVPCVATSSVVEYTIVVKNDGSDPAFQVLVRDTLPAGFTFISADDTVAGPNAFQCTIAANVVSCTSAMIPGGSTTRTIILRAFSAAQPGDYTNQVVVDPNNSIPEGNETNNTAQETTRVRVGAGFIDLTVKKCDVAIVDGCEPPAAPDTKDTGSVFSYFLEVKNNGTDAAFNVTVRDTLPAGVTFISASDLTTLPGAFICTEAGGVVTCTGGTLDGSLDLISDDPATVAVNEDVPTTRTIRITVRAPQQHNVLLTNQAFIDPTNAIGESNETNNQAFETTSIQSPFNLVLDKEGPDQAHQNDEEDYTITVTNEGPAVDDVVVVDALPVGLIPLSISATPSNFICEFTENPVNGVRCVGDMGATGSDTAVVTITIHVFVTQDGGPLDNEACVDPDNNVIEHNEGDNCDTKTTAIIQFSPNLSVQKSGPSTASAGETITYTVTVSNIGNANAAEPVTITDELPDAVSIVGTPVATNGFMCVHDGSAIGGDVTCTDPTDGDDIGLAVGSFTQITIQATVSDDADTPFTNTASVPDNTAFDANSAPCDPTPTPCENETSINNGNNSDSVTTSVSGSAIDLVMGDITDVVDPSNIGDSLTYTFTVTNGGSQNALAVDGNEVVIRVDMPTVGVNFQSGIGTQGFVCVATNSNALLTCTGDLDAGELTTVTVEFTVTAATPPKLTIKAKVDPNDDIVETNEANNAAEEDTTVNTAACNSCIDLVMGQIFADPNPGVDGQQATYSFTVTNIGDLSTETDPIPNDVKIRIDLDRGADESSFVSYTATGGFTCSQPFLLDLVPSTDIECVDDGTGVAAGAGTLITITVAINTAVTPSFVDFDVDVDLGNLIDETPFEFNNEGGLRIDVVAP